MTIGGELIKEKLKKERQRLISIPLLGIYCWKMINERDNIAKNFQNVIRMDNLLIELIIN
ncbi:hypothetical protein ABE28_021190 [Peribacillus muralis]|uniref:Uncharacterized protein n=1 Tax=Peribacillus muralis TaxID=264697 RepID=A0A1B3XUI2_9BACI|nr:hypothetical protein ABE28_021190 [Peribacillus muralis]